MYSKKRKKRNSGFTLIEMLIFIFIFTIAGVTFYRLFTTSMKAMGNVRHRLEALALANEKIEIIHNLSYESIGTTSGIPVGELVENETVVRGSRNLFVKTSVIVVDDPFDGKALYEADTNPDDYKQVRVQVSWEQNNPSKEVVLVSTIVPPGLESIYTGGILSINVVDNSGQGIPNARVTIRNDSLNPVVNTTLTTNDQGGLFIPQATPANQSYNLSVVKSGYFPVQTFAPYPSSVINPVDTDATVVGGAINQKTLMTDLVSTVNLRTVTPLGVPVADIRFGLTGGKRIGNTVAVEPASPAPVWAYNNDALNSGTSGNITLSEMSSGSYFLTYGESAKNSEYKFLQMDLANNLSNSFNVLPGITLDEAVIVAEKNVDSLWLTVMDNVDETPIADATIRLRNFDASYDVTLVTNKFGKVFFPDSSVVLAGGEHRIDVSAPGYSSINEQSIVIDKLTVQDIKMTAE